MKKETLTKIMTITAIIISSCILPHSVLAEETEPVTLTFWSWLPTIDQSEEIIAEFEKQNPNIKVNYVRTELEDYTEKLQVALASGNGPDLFGLTTGAMAEEYLPYAEDMNDLGADYWDEWKEVIQEDAVEQCTVSDGTVVGMPLLIAGMTELLYNKTLMEECGISKIPETYKELKSAAKKAKKKGFICVAVGAADGWVNSDWFVQISNEFEKGAVYEAEKGKRSWTDKCFVDTLNAWKKIFEDDIFETGALGVSTYPDASDRYFLARRAVFFLTGSWHLVSTSPSSNELKGTEVGKKGDTIGMCMFPSMTEKGNICGTSGVDIMLAVNRECKEKEAAMKLVEFMAHGDGQQKWINTLQGFTVAKDIRYTGTIDGELQQQSMDEINDYISHAVGNRKISDSEIETAIQIAMQNVAAGANPVEELRNVQNQQETQ